MPHSVAAAASASTVGRAWRRPWRRRGSSMAGRTRAGSHLCGGERHLRHSMSQAGSRSAAPSRAARPAQGMKEHELGPSVLAVAGAAAGEAAGCADLDPVGRAVDRAPEQRRVHEGLWPGELRDRPGRPVARQTARAQRERPRAEIARAAGEDQEARVVGHQVKTAELEAAVPADPAVARTALQRRRREHQKRHPAPPMVRDIAHRLSHPGTAPR